MKIIRFGHSLLFKKYFKFINNIHIFLFAISMRLSIDILFAKFQIFTLKLSMDETGFIFFRAFLKSRKIHTNCFHLKIFREKCIFSQNWFNKKVFTVEKYLVCFYSSCQPGINSIYRTLALILAS